jgi:hypothetical protein
MRKLRPWLAVLAIAVGSALIAGGGAAVPARAAAGAASGPRGHWGPAQAVRGAVAGAATPASVAEVTALSCRSAGNCTGGGSFSDAKGMSQGFVVSAKRDRWGTAIQLLGPSDAVSSMVNAVSCSGAGNCLAAGSFLGTGEFSHAFLVQQANGAWGAAAAVPGLDAINKGSAEVDATACPAKGSCVAVGGFSDSKGNTTVFVTEQVGAVWLDAQPLKGLDFLNRRGLAFVHALSCPLPGDCVAVGSYLGQGGFTQAFEAEQVNGTWEDAQPVSGVPSLNSGNSNAAAVACASLGNCAVSGTYTDAQHKVQVFVVDEKAGSWQLAEQVPGMPAINNNGAGNEDAAATSLSCPTAGNCALAGFVTGPDQQHAAFVDDERNGGWQQAQTLGGSGTVVTPVASEAHSVSCAAPGDCVVGGFALVDPGMVQRAFIATEVNGSWGMTRELPGSAALNAGASADVAVVSCPSAGNCAAGGSYTDAGGLRHAMTADKSTKTAVTLSLSAAKVTFGHERAERISVKVTPRTGGTPGGRVTVRAGARNTALCVITLAKGRGSCLLPAKKLRPGTYKLTARYGGSRVYSGSTSGTKTLTVAR